MTGNNIIIVSNDAHIFIEGSPAKKIKLGSGKLEVIGSKGYKVAGVQGKRMINGDMVQETTKVVMEPVMSSSITPPVYEKAVEPPTMTAKTVDDVRSVSNDNWQLDNRNIPETPKKEVPAYSTTTVTPEPYSAKRIDDRPAYPFEASPVREPYSAPVREPYSAKRVEEPTKEVQKPTYSFEQPSPKEETPMNAQTMKVNRSEEFRRMRDRIGERTMRGMVLDDGLSRLDAIEKAKVDIATNIVNYEETLKKLEEKQKVVSASAREIDDMLSMTQSISLEDIRKAQQGDYSGTVAHKNANDAFSRIKEEIDKIKEAKAEEENRLLELEQERKRLVNERTNEQTRLRSAETEEDKICKDIDEKLRIAEEAENVQAQLKELVSKLSINTEPPKRANAFDRMRNTEDEYQRGTR